MKVRVYWDAKKRRWVVSELSGRRVFRAKDEAPFKMLFWGLDKNQPKVYLMVAHEVSFLFEENNENGG